MPYRAGLPGWKLAARLGVPIGFVINVHYDPEVRSYWASSDDLDGLVVSGESLDEVHRESLSAAELLIEMALPGSQSRAVAELRYSAPVQSRE